MAVLTTRVQRFFHLFFFSTSEKSFILYKPSAAVQALEVCPVRPSLSSLAKSLVQLGNTFITQSSYGCLKKCLQLSSSAKNLVQLGNTFITQSSCGCLKKCLQLSILSQKLHTYPKKSTKKKLGNNFVREAEGCR